MTRILDRMKKINYNTIIVIILGLAVLLIPFLNINGLNVWGIIKAYYKGDIFITYEDFPDIGEWLSIATTCLFSYLLWKATVKSNEINKNNLKLQQQIEYKEDKIMLSRIIAQISDLNSTVSIAVYLSEQKRVELNAEQKFTPFKVSLFEISQETLSYIHGLLDEDCSEVMRNVSLLNTSKEIANGIIESEEYRGRDNKEGQLARNNLTNTVELLIETSKELNKQLNVLLKYLNYEFDKRKIKN